MALLTFALIAAIGIPLACKFGIEIGRERAIVEHSCQPCAVDPAEFHAPGCRCCRCN